MGLEGVREAIDLIDADITSLLRKRFELAVRAGKIKGHVEDVSREQEVIDNVKRSAAGLVTPEFTGKLFREIIEEAKRQQHADHKVTGFQGEHGAYSEMASLEFSSDTVTIPFEEFEDVFEGVRDGAVDLGVVPVENTIGGSVTEVDDLLIESGLSVVGEINFAVHHCLLALPETDYRDVRVVYSHPQGISQCRDFLVRNKLEGRPYYNTAGAAKMLARERPVGTAVIASRLCADIYGLEILKENVENDVANTTRFLVLSKEPLKDGGDKCSIVFVTQHKPGALYNFLRAFSDAEINLTRIESRPAKGKPGSVAFLLDFQGSDRDPNIAATLDNIRGNCQEFRLLGCYKESRQGQN